MPNNLNFRIHPAIGIARVGNSAEYYLGPETAAGDTSTTPSGGLPIKKDTESDTITSSDLRDINGAFKRQAARFKIYQYADSDADSNGTETYPLGPAACMQEIKIGSTVNGQTVFNIIWTVHLANKKAQFYQADPQAPLIGGASSFNGKLPPLRNPNFPEPGVAADDPQRLSALIIDPGPRTIFGQNSAAVSFDSITQASYFDGQTVKYIPDYPKSFPGDHFPALVEPQGPITTLGELQTDASGRLIVTGGYGRSAQWGNQALTGPVDNDGWFDDAGDGPVTAVIILSDGSQLAVQGSAWVCATDPSYAPQIKNVVSLWEDMYDTWVRLLGLDTNLYANGAFIPGYVPGFDNQVNGVFNAAEMQQWIGNLPSSPGSTTGGDPHSSHPITYNGGTTTNQFFTILRNPSMDLNDTYLSADGRTPYMPLCLGDNGQSFMSITKTQYFFVSQWANGICNPGSAALGAGELLDQNVLLNCLGGRFSPGIDLTWIIRDANLYIQNWKVSGTGPFRINQQALDYSQITPGQAFLTQGYVPLLAGAGIQPGDVLKLMALPWHTDYNSCANHPPDPGFGGKTIYPAPPTPQPRSGPAWPTSYSDYSFWSWPAQRPVAAFTSTLPKAEAQQWYTLRGKGTDPLTDPSNPHVTTTPELNVCRYQTIADILTNWQNAGVVMQAEAIDGVDPGYIPGGNRGDHTWYLETQCLMGEGVAVPAWPNYLPEKQAK